MIIDLNEYRKNKNSRGSESREVLEFSEPDHVEAELSIFSLSTEKNSSAINNAVKRAQERGW